MFRRLLEHARTLWRLAIRERASPRQIALAVWVGVFVGCTPAIGFHAGVAALAATVVRLSRLWAIIGSRVSNFVMLPWIVLAEIQVAHRLRTGEWTALNTHTVLQHTSELMLDWCIGTLPIGALLATLLGALAYVLARRREARRAAAASAEERGGPEMQP